MVDDDAPVEYYDWWLAKMRNDPEWVVNVEADVERAKIIRETRSWLED